MKKELSLKEVKIIKGKIEGKSSTEIGLEVYPNQTPASAKASVNKLLRKASLQDAVHAELLAQGNTLKSVLAPVTKALNAKIKHKGYEKEVIKEGNRTITRDKQIVISEEDNIPLQLSGHDRAVKLLGIDKMHDAEVITPPLDEEELKELAETSDEIELTRILFKKNKT